MLKEITAKESLSYTHRDFREVVAAFKEGIRFLESRHRGRY
jgi:hypothetical protein